MCCCSIDFGLHIFFLSFLFSFHFFLFLLFSFHYYISQSVHLYCQFFFHHSFCARFHWQTYVRVTEHTWGHTLCVCVKKMMFGMNSEAEGIRAVCLFNDTIWTAKRLNTETKAVNRNSMFFSLSHTRSLYRPLSPSRPSALSYLPHSIAQMNKWFYGIRMRSTVCMYVHAFVCVCVCLLLLRM